MESFSEVGGRMESAGVDSMELCVTSLGRVGDGGLESFM